ncbi:MAG TPA: NUDIX domain-containing protein [Pseudonocardiaceae bacterium]
MVVNVQPADEVTPEEAASAVVDTSMLLMAAVSTFQALAESCSRLTLSQRRRAGRTSAGLVPAHPVTVPRRLPNHHQRTVRTVAGCPPSAPSRISARVLLLDPDRALRIHACDPDNRSHHWWELPGGRLDPGESLIDSARCEAADESGITLTHLGPRLRVRESCFHYRPR